MDCVGASCEAAPLESDDGRSVSIINRRARHKILSEFIALSPLFLRREGAEISLKLGFMLRQNEVTGTSGIETAYSAPQPMREWLPLYQLQGAH